MSDFKITNELDDNEDLFIDITLEDDEVIECQVIAIYEANGRDYIAVLPLEGEEYDEGEVYLYRYFEDEDGDPNLDNIETEEEYEIASEAFDELMDDEEYDEIVTDE